MSNHVKGMTSCRPPEKSNESEIKSNESEMDLINRRDAIDAIRAMQTYKLFAGDDMRLVDQAGTMTELMMLPSAQPNLPEWARKVEEYRKSAPDTIYNPLAWALYQTWKEYDR